MIASRRVVETPVGRNFSGGLFASAAARRSPAFTQEVAEVFRAYFTSSTDSFTAALGGIRSRNRSWYKPMRNEIATGKSSRAIGFFSARSSKKSSKPRQRNTPRVNSVARAASSGRTSAPSSPCNTSLAYAPSASTRRNTSYAIFLATLTGMDFEFDDSRQTISFVQVLLAMKIRTKRNDSSKSTRRSDHRI